MTAQGLCQRRMRTEGRCVTCCQPHTSGLARCRACQDRANRRRKMKRAKLIAAGRCQECWAGLLGVSKFTRCLDCRIKLADLRRRSRQSEAA